MVFPADLKHLLIICPSWVGDVVMGSCAWDAARQAMPQARITAMIRPHLAELLEGVTAVDQVLPVSTKRPLAAAREVAATGADAALLLPNSFRSAAVAWCARVPLRGGYARDRRSWLLTDAVPVPRSDTPAPTALYYLHLVNTLFGTNIASSLPTLDITDAHHNAASAMLPPHDGPLVLLVPGASKEEKRWPAAKFAAVADALHENHGCTCCIVASPQEREIAAAITEVTTEPIVDLSSEPFGLGSLKAAVAMADLLITNDTGPRHLAVATGTPTVTLYGPTDARWTAYDGDNNTPLLADPFLPVGLVADDNPRRCTIDRITVGDVLAAALRHI